jgi:hypothetical protein
MTAVWIDLLTGTPPLKTAGPLFSGQWVVNQCPKGLRLNGIDAAVGDRLLADNRNRWFVNLPSGGTVEGVFTKTHPVSDGDFDALIRMQESFSEFPNLSATWSDWAEASPLAPRIEDEIRIRKLDEFLEERLLFLEAVCRSPRNHLRIDADLQPVSRARRIANQAIARLASHREDWERPTVLGVRPKRVLCLVPDEEIDLYENRVAARLVDHLRSYLGTRLARLRGILRMLAEADHSNETSGAYWRQRQRLFSIWGEAVKDDSARRIASATQARLETLHLRVLALLDSMLYRGVPKSSRVTGLRITNIFLNDSNYRQVAAIWREWSNEGLERDFSDLEKFRREQKACQGMALFARVLIARALRQIGLAPTSASAAPLTGLRPVVHLEGIGGTATVSIEPQGAILIKTPSSTLRIVPLINTTAVKRGPDTAVAPIGNIVPGIAEHLLVLHLPRSLSVEPTQLEDGSVGSSSILPQWQPTALLPSTTAAIAVSPWSISSVERVARFLRWHIYAPCLVNFPPSIEPVQQLPMPATGWLKRGKLNRLLVLRRPSPKEEGTENLVRKFAEAEFRRLAARGGRVAQHARTDADSAAETLRSNFRVAFDKLTQFEQCPVCHELGGFVNPLDDEGRAFVAQCQNSSCKSSWGCYACGGRRPDQSVCRAQVPFISVQGLDEWLQSSVELFPNWAEVRFGADLLTEPRRDDSGKPRWLCAACLKCP